MDQGLGLTTFLQWLDYLFPSLSQYTKYVGPALMFAASAIGIFTNLLPEPNHKYPVPNVTELETELAGSGKLILRLAKFARTVTVVVNWFIATAPYEWFYNATNKVSNVITRIKGGVVSKNPPSITPPSPFVVKIPPAKDKVPTKPADDTKSTPNDKA